jgi:triacylglycerol lipase
MTMWFRGLPARRRRFVAGVAVLAAAAICAIAITSLHSRAEASPPAKYPAQSRPGPVLLVFGDGGRTGSLSVLAGRIRATGRTATVLHLPGNGTGSLVRDAAVLNQAVSRALRAGAPSVDVIGYSAGGVATLLWARDDHGNRKARRVVTLGSPFHGTVLTAAAQVADPGVCPTACTQLLPGSSLLTGLAAGAPARLPWLSLWTIDDRTVTPPTSARLTGAIDVPIQSVCPQQKISHGHLPVNQVVTAMVLQAIGPGPMIHHPSPADCGRRTAAADALAGDVLGREMSPGGGEEDRYVDGLYGQAPVDVAPQDRIAEEVDPRQPVSRRQIGRDR